MVPAIEASYVLAAGGTGGHVYPAIAVAEALVARGHARGDIRFVVDARPATAEAVARAGFAYDVLPLDHGFTRGDVPANPRGRGRGRARDRPGEPARRLAPHVVVAFGAYAAFPIVVGARLHRIPVVVHEQNAHPGIVSRIAVRLGAHAAASIAGTPLRRRDRDR